jgi:hypothetical protein
MGRCLWFDEEYTRIGEKNTQIYFEDDISAGSKSIDARFFAGKKKLFLIYFWPSKLLLKMHSNTSFIPKFCR